ncbi:uncharacterized protein LOC132255515 [Phlebotomus argentipes]|uniref:uncharacterized protein LOC132255515 n=1 Tax=Phlebotomus argentipes TaxID=94469 RepID=UPI0028935644|nr:uncharacterized protein LOC132255515 [Phlebotomus argentipes]XP_059607572.1 uncharacterized protein LOC132255515 [Phlebotomus argentipes]
MDRKALVLHLLLLLTIFAIPGENTFLRDSQLSNSKASQPSNADGSALHLKALDKEIFEKFVKPTASDLSETILAQAKDTVESVLQHKDEFLLKAKEKVGSSLKTIEQEGSELLSKAKEKMGNSLQQNEQILAQTKDKLGSSLKTIEQEGSELLSKAKGRMESKLQERDELVAKAKDKIGTLIEKKEIEGPILKKPLEKESSLLEMAKSKMQSSLKALEEDGSSLLAKAKEKGSTLIEKVTNPSLLKPIQQDKSMAKSNNAAESDDKSSLLTRAKETVEKSLLLRTLTNGEGSLFNRAKEKVENSLLGKSLKDSESFILGKSKETTESAKKFNLLGAKPFNSLFPSFGSNAPKISGLKLLYPLRKDEAPIVEVADFQDPVEEIEVKPQKKPSPDVCFSRPPAKEVEPIAPVLPENKPLDYDKIEEGYYEDSREFDDDLPSLVDYEEVPEKLNIYSDEELDYPDYVPQGMKVQKRHISYNRLFKKPSKTKTGTEEKMRERVNRGIGHVKKIIGIAGQVDSFLTGKIRNSLRSLANMVENEDDYKNGH